MSDFNEIKKKRDLLIDNIIALEKDCYLKINNLADAGLKDENFDSKAFAYSLDDVCSLFKSSLKQLLDQYLLTVGRLNDASDVYLEMSETLKKYSNKVFDEVYETKFPLL